MRRYLYTTGALYILVGLLIGIRPVDVYVSLDKTPLFSDVPYIQITYTSAFILSGLLALAGGFTRRAVMQGIGLSSLAGVGTAWCALTAASAIVYGTDAVRPFLWLYILASIYRSLPYSSLSIEGERSINGLLKSIHDTMHDSDNRTNRSG